MATRKNSSKGALKVSVVSMPESNGTSPSKWVEPEERRSGEFSDYEVRGALRTLASARKIQKNPHLMKAVRKEAQRQLQAAQSTVKTL